MPRYLRWIAAMTAGITGYFVYAFITFGIARATGRTELRGGAGAVIAFGAYVVVSLSALGVNDWLSARYPTPTRAARRAAPSATAAPASTVPAED